MIVVNNRAWHIVYVNPNSKKLLNGNGTYTLGVTDNQTSSIYINNRLKGRMLDKVISHELCHVFCFSYGVVVDRQTEELMADFLATYGREIFDKVDDILFRFAKIS